jgi:hypothetical protein
MRDLPEPVDDDQGSSAAALARLAACLTRIQETIAECMQELVQLSKDIEDYSVSASEQLHLAAGSVASVEAEMKTVEQAARDGAVDIESESW